uniref:Maestro heat like repeat family member 7 n=1 Tax=Sus scrofa TaxID=9823 RepID=A0A8D1V9M5_PIG
SEREAYEFIVDFLEQEQEQLDKLKFLRAVSMLSGAVHAQADGTMDDFVPKAVLAKKIEAFILEEPLEVLVGPLRQQAMLCIVALRFLLCHFCWPPSLLHCTSPTCQTIQALDDMVQALMMENAGPSMVMLQSFLEIILPWLVESEKVHEQTRALGTISRMLRSICSFPELSHVAEFSMSGKLMGTLGLFCMNSNYEISMGASEALHYLFKVLVLHRITVPPAGPDASQTAWGRFPPQSFQKYLTPEERADVLVVSMGALTSTSRHDAQAASEMLRMILKFSLPEIGKVPEIVTFIYLHINSITEATAQETVKKILHLLARTYTDEVILTLFKIDDQSQRGARKPWEILASFPKGYEVIMEYLLQRLSPQPESRGDGDAGPALRPLQATRAIHELLLEPSRKMEMQAFYSPLFMALLFQISTLLVEGAAEAFQDQQHVTEWVDPISSTVEALKALMRSTGYSDLVSYIQKLRGWELLTSPERHHEGVALLARAMVVKNCWHNRPIFSLVVRMLQELEHENHLTALVFLTELLWSPDMAAIVDEVTLRMLASWFQCKEPAVVKLLLRAVEILAMHGNMVTWNGAEGAGCPLSSPFPLRALQPYVLNCCYSEDSGIVAETFKMLKCLVEQLTWEHSSAFLIQLAFTLGPFLEEESELLRLMAFESYGALLAKVSRRVLVFPLRHQVFNLLILLVLHLEDVNADLAASASSLCAPPALLSLQIARPALCHTATVLRWSKLKVIFAEKDTWTILRALLKKEASKALWFLKQSVTLFRSPQAPIRQAAVWFAGQILQTLSDAEAREVEEAFTALRDMQEDPDPAVSCLAVQTFYVLEAKEKRPVASSTSCFCIRRP